MRRKNLVKNIATIISVATVSMSTLAVNIPSVYADEVPTTETTPEPQAATTDAPATTETHSSGSSATSSEGQVTDDTHGTGTQTITTTQTNGDDGSTTTQVTVDTEYADQTKTNTSTTTQTNADGSGTQTYSDTTSNADGSGTQTVSDTTINADGSSSGNTATTVTAAPVVSEPVDVAASDVPTDLKDDTMYESSASAPVTATNDDGSTTTTYTSINPTSTEVTGTNEYGETVVTTVTSWVIYTEVKNETTGETTTTSQTVYKLCDKDGNEITTGNENLNNILALIGNYGVVANEVTVNNDIQSSIATGNLTLNHSISSNLDNGADYKIYTEAITNPSGNPVNVDTSATIVVPEGYELFLYDQNLKDAKSTAFKAYRDSLTNQPNDGRYIVKFTDNGDGTYTVSDVMGNNTRLDNVSTTTTDRQQFTDQTVEQVIGKVSELSDKLSNDAMSSSNCDVTWDDNSGNQVIDSIKANSQLLADIADGNSSVDVLYANVDITLSSTDITTNPKSIENTDLNNCLKIYLTDENQICIVNLNISVSDDATENDTSIKLCNYKLFVNDTEVTDKVFFTNHVFWNLSGYSGNVLLGNFYGTLIAPEASVEARGGVGNGSPTEGRSVSNTFVNNDCEFHSYTGSHMVTTKEDITTPTSSSSVSYTRQEKSQKKTKTSSSWSEDIEDPDDPDTPETPETPDTPSTPDTPTTTETTITETPVALAAEPAVLGVTRTVAQEPEVLGATRTLEEDPAVLGAFRDGQTGDSTNSMARMGIIISCAGLAAATVIAGRRKRKINN